jgi:tRNA U34 5-carboxymethylaminomethyl modifying enzyme MnmG/GidA
MKSLSTLIKLQKTRVDEQRQLLAKLQEQLDILQKQITELEIKKAREQVAAEEHPEARVTYGAFLKAAVKKGRELDKERQGTEIAIDIAHGKLAELFEEQKRYEIAEAARIENEAYQERRRERIDLDEVGSVTYVRKKE